jgi:hypothetical protein
MVANKIVGRHNFPAPTFARMHARHVPAVQSGARHRSSNRPGLFHDDDEDTSYPCRDGRPVGIRPGSNCDAQNYWQAEAGKAGGADGMQARRNCQRDQALGRRLCGGVRTSWYHIPGRAHAYPRSKSPSCKTREVSVASRPGSVALKGTYLFQVGYSGS